MANKKKILVIEDDVALMNAIRTKLEKSGFDVVGAKSGPETYAALGTGGPADAIWLDHYLLGKESGLDILARIKQEPAWQNIPVFVVSNSASPDKETAYRALGAVKYYVKADHRLDEVIGDIGGLIGA